jgi:mono/diheme cytochrome c family protein
MVRYLRVADAVQIRVAACAVTVAWSLLNAAATLSAQDPVEQGREIFQTTCAVCHTIGGGNLVGPDLQGVTERRDEDWIIRFVQHSTEVVESGDSVAVALFEQFYRVPMPDQPLTDEQIRAVLAYTQTDAAVTAAAPEPLPEATAEQILLGQALFQGHTRFTNGGPTCNSCHEVTNDAVIGGGLLARDLTTVFSRLGGPGVRAVVGSSPYPVMQRAYLENPLTDDEVVALVGFLKKADEEQAFHQPRDYGPKLFGAGVAGTLVLFVSCSLVWNGRKRGSVNQAIFDRQVRST